MGISFLTVLTFYLPSDSGEKVCINILHGTCKYLLFSGNSIHTVPAYRLLNTILLADLMVPHGDATLLLMMTILILFS